MISEKQLKKRAVFFGLDDVLIPGCVDAKVNAKEVEKILRNLEAVQKKSKNFWIGVDFSW